MCSLSIGLDRQTKREKIKWINVAVAVVFVVCWWSEMLLSILHITSKQVYGDSYRSQTTGIEPMLVGNGTLPISHRLANSHACNPPVAVNSSISYTSSAFTDAKVDRKSARALALGGYERIAKGSGFIPQTGPILMILSQLQLFDLSLTGSVGEIGVHHGRFTSFLFATARKTEDLVVADLFEDLQDQNIDFSGSGNKEKFIKGLNTYGLDENDLHTIVTGSSMDIPFDWSFQSGFSPFRLISIDGGHTAEITFNDLQIAFCNTLPGGVVILDDFFHGAWPGVTEGFFQLLHHPPNQLQNVHVYPFLACKSKLFLTNNFHAYEVYYEGLFTRAPDLIRPFAHEKTRGSVKYSLNGVPYLMCRNEVELDSIQKMWAKLVF